MAFSVDRNSYPGMWWTLLPDSLPAAAGLQTEGGAKGERGERGRCKGQWTEAAARLRQSLRWVICRQTCWRMKSRWGQLCVPSKQVKRLICVHGGHWEVTCDQANKSQGFFPASGGPLLDQHTVFKSIRWWCLTSLFSPEQSLLAREWIVLRELTLPYRALADWGMRGRHRQSPQTRVQCPRHHEWRSVNWKIVHFHIMKNLEAEGVIMKTHKERGKERVRAVKNKIKSKNSGNYWGWKSLIGW